MLPCPGSTEGGVQGRKVCVGSFRQRYEHRTVSRNFFRTRNFCQILQNYRESCSGVIGYFGIFRIPYEFFSNFMNFFRISGFWAATKSCIEFLVGIMNLKKCFADSLQVVEIL